MFVCLFLIHWRKRVKSKYFSKNMSIIFLLKKVVQVVWISIIVWILFSNEKKINFPICISAPSWKGANKLFFKTVPYFSWFYQINLNHSYIIFCSQFIFVQKKREKTILSDLDSQSLFTKPSSNFFFDSSNSESSV